MAVAIVDKAKEIRKSMSGASDKRTQRCLVLSWSHDALIKNLELFGGVSVDRNSPNRMGPEGWMIDLGNQYEDETTGEPTQICCEGDGSPICLRTKSSVDKAKDANKIKEETKNGETVSIHRQVTDGVWRQAQQNQKRKQFEKATPGVDGFTRNMWIVGIVGMVVMVLGGLAIWIG